MWSPSVHLVDYVPIHVMRVGWLVGAADWSLRGCREVLNQDQSWDFEELKNCIFCIGVFCVFLCVIC